MVSSKQNRQSQITCWEQHFAACLSLPSLSDLFTGKRANTIAEQQRGVSTLKYIEGEMHEMSEKVIHKTKADDNQCLISNDGLLNLPRMTQDSGHAFDWGL